MHLIVLRLWMAFLILAAVLIPFSLMALIALTAGEEKKHTSSLQVTVVLLMDLALQGILFYAAHGRKPGVFISMFMLNCSDQDLLSTAIFGVIGMTLSAAAGVLMRFLLTRVNYPAMPKKAKGYILVLFSIGMIIFILSGFWGFNEAKNLVISGVCRRMTQSELDENGEETEVKSSYVTVRNIGIFANEGDSLFLKLEEDDPVSYPTGSYYILSGEEHTFFYDPETEPDIPKNEVSELLLYHKNGILLDRTKVPALQPNTAWVMDAGGSFVSRSIEQEVEEEVVVARPKSDPQAGFYSGPLDVTLTAGEGCRIYYTLDGSVPTEESALYEGPIHLTNPTPVPNRYRSVSNVTYTRDWYEKAENVDKAAVLRARALSEDGRWSELITRTYFIDLDQYKNRNVISLTADPEDLFGDQGIYVTGPEYDAWYEQHESKADHRGSFLPADAPKANFDQRGQEWEKRATLEFYSDSNLILRQICGIRIQGYSSRWDTLKRFSLYSRKEYNGSKWFDRNLFGDYKFHSAVLRQGQTNAIVPGIMRNRDVTIQDAIPVSVFLDGEFWYDTYIQPKYNEKYFSQLYGLSEDNIVMVKAGDTRGIEDESENPYSSIHEFIKTHDLSDPEAYRQFGEIIDIQSYIDYTVGNIYIANMDQNEEWNVICWHTIYPENNREGDGRWRWAYYDMDLVIYYISRRQGLENDAMVNGFGQTIDRVRNKEPIYEALKRNPDYCRQFVLTFMDLVNDNFSREKMEKYLAAWGLDMSYHDHFFELRTGYILPYLEMEFDLKGTRETVRLTADHPEGGSVRLNTITPDLSSGSWQGTYYTDYPVTVTAEPAPGWAFDGFTVTGKEFREDSITLDVPHGGMTINAKFRKQ